jgi:hypothetical protein
MIGRAPSPSDGSGDERKPDAAHAGRRIVANTAADKGLA